MTQGTNISRTGVGSIIARKSSAKGHSYRRVWIYVPAKVSEDSAFPFKPGDPAEVTITEDNSSLTVKPISIAKAKQRGWAKRQRHSRSTEAGAPD